MGARMDVLLGAQWGDEGKGKVVDVVAPRYQVVARFQGGPNAGHTLWIEGRKHVLHTVPSGVFHDGVMNLVGNGVVIDPVIFLQELDGIAASGADLQGRLAISRRAHLILPTHRALDAASEAEKGKERIGSTLKGIGPTYMDKTGRNGLRVGDLERGDLHDRYRGLVRKHERLLGMYTEARLETARGRVAGRLGTPEDLPLRGQRALPGPGLPPGPRGARGRGPRHPARHRFRHLSLRHEQQHHLCRSLHRPGGSALAHRPRDRHLQGLLHPRGQRALPHGAHGRYRRPHPQGGQRVRKHHGTAAPMRLARPARPALRGDDQRRERAGHDEGRRAQRHGDHPALHALQSERPAHRQAALRHQRHGRTCVYRQ